MSLYRKTMHDGVLVRVKRKLIRAWIWSFNRSEEDHITAMRNRLALLNTEVRTLRRILPKAIADVEAQKKKLMEQGGFSHATRDSWSSRKPPLRLKEPEGKAPERKKESKCKPQPHTLARIVTGN